MWEWFLDNSQVQKGERLFTVDSSCNSWFTLLMKKRCLISSDGWGYLAAGEAVQFLILFLCFQNLFCLRGKPIQSGSWISVPLFFFSFYSVQGLLKFRMYLLFLFNWKLLLVWRYYFLKMERGSMFKLMSTGREEH